MQFEHIHNSDIVRSERAQLWQKQKQMKGGKECEIVSTHEWDLEQGNDEWRGKGKNRFATNFNQN